MSQSERTPLSAEPWPSVAVPLGLIEKARPEDAARLFDRLFDAAERKFGDYPAFEIKKRGKRLVVAMPRDAGPQRAPHVSPDAS